MLKKQLLSLSISLSLSLFSLPLVAQSSNVCDEINGVWEGTWYAWNASQGSHCEYQVNATGSINDSSVVFQIRLSHGRPVLLCKRHYDFGMNGTCIDGKLNLSSGLHGNIAGKTIALGNDGNNVSLIKK